VQSLNPLPSITEKSGKFRKDLKQDILVSVSTLRKEISTMKMQLKSAEDEQKKIREEVKNAKEAKARGDSRTTRQVAPSLDHIQQYTRSGVQQVTPSDGGRRKLFSEAVKKEDNKRYRITLTPKVEALSPDQIKTQLKRNINPTDIKVGIKAIGTIREGRIIIETGSEEEVNKLNSELTTSLENGWKLQCTD
jgi:small-conductance mechanosensitive channel